MLRKLEELDRLDALTRSSEEVLWPSGLSSRADPRAWAPRHGRPRTAARWWERYPRAGIVVCALVVLGLVSAQRWMPTADLATGRAQDAVGGEDFPPEIATPDGEGFYAFSARQSDGVTPVAFDPCAAVHYVVRPHADGTDGLDIVREAVAKVAEATGLEFVEEGLTDEKVNFGRAPRQLARYGPGNAPVLIAWSDPTETPRLAGDTVGLGGGTMQQGALGRLTYMTGAIALDTPSLAAIGAEQGGRERVVAVVMHELGHVMGLGHVRRDGEIMGEAGGADFGPGDRAGLAALGSAGCD